MTAGANREVIYRIKEDAFVSRTIAGEAFIVPLNTPLEKLFQTNPTAAVLLEALKEGMSEEAMVALLRSRFNAPPEENVSEDVARFLAVLKENGFVSVEP